MGLFSDGVAGLHGGAATAKENYRSIGRGNGGVPVSSKRNFHWRDFDCATTPSIPGKFETVLYRGNREDGGFGSRAPRFGQEERHGEMPGPGHHGVAKSALADNAVGKRGHGAFASKTPRQQAAKSSPAPGPGFYGDPSSVSAPYSETDRCRPSATFVPPTSVNPAKYNARPSPGPGDYSGATGLATSVHSRFPVDNRGAVMSSVAEPTHSSTETPGPGAYYRERQRPASGEPGRQVSSLLKTPRGWSEVPVKPVSQAGLMRLGAELLAEDSAQTSSMPGPGQYDPKPEATSGGGPVSFCAGETYAFRLGNSHMSRRWRGDGGPGPCDYEAPPARPKGDLSAASLKSKVSRFTDKEAEAPGPAYYSPRKTADTDFHLNPHSLWK